GEGGGFVFYGFSPSPGVAINISIFLPSMDVRSVHRHAHSDVQLGISSSGRVSSERRCRRHNLNAHDIGDECFRHLNPRSLPCAHPLVSPWQRVLTPACRLKQSRKHSASTMELCTRSKASPS